MNEDALVDSSIDTVLSSLLGLWQDLLARSPLLLAGVLVLLLTWGIAKLADRMLGRALRNRRFKRGFKDLLRQLTVVAVWVAGLTVAAVVMFPGMTPAKVLAGLGLGSIALGFAFKDIVENFLAGLLILWRFPFDPDDFIRYGDIEGRVEQITVRMTLIRQTNGELVVLPNAKLFKDAVKVLTSLPIRRVTVVCGVAYGEDVDDAREVMRAAVEGCDSVSRERPIEIFAQAFGSSSIDFEVTWWCGSKPLEVRASRDQVVAAVKRGLDEAGIEIPFPYRTLTFREPLRVRSGADDDDPEPKAGA